MKKHQRCPVHSGQYRSIYATVPVFLKLPDGVITAKYVLRSKETLALKDELLIPLSYTSGSQTVRRDALMRRFNF